MSITLDGNNATTTGVINSGTAVASTSGTSIDFTGIPAGVKRVTVMFNGVSTNGTSNIQVQIGSGSITPSGYVSGCSQLNTSSMSTGAATTTGYLVQSNVTAATSFSGNAFFTTLGSNIWVSSSNLFRSDGVMLVGSGQASLAGTLDRIRITTVNGTDTFDAGSINILYE